MGEYPEYIEKAIRERDPKLLFALNKELIRRGDQAMVEEGFKGIISLLRVKDEFVRKSAATYLGGLGKKEALEPLRELLDDKSNAVSIAATLALGMLGDNRVSESLISLLVHGDKHTRIAAAFSLWELGCKCIDDPLRLISDLHKTLAAESLISLLNDHDPVICEDAANVLTKITGKSFIFAKTSYAKWNVWWLQNKYALLRGRQ